MFERYNCIYFYEVQYICSFFTGFKEVCGWVENLLLLHPSWYYSQFLNLTHNMWSKLFLYRYKDSSYIQCVSIMRQTASQKSYLHFMNEEDETEKVA